MELHFADIWESIATLIPDRAAIVQGERRTSWSEYEARAARLAAYLSTHGVREGATVGLYLHNCPEYLEAQFAAFKLRAVPINVNYRYLDDELAYLLDDADVEALIFGTDLAARVEAVRHRLPRLRVLVEVGISTATGAAEYEDVIRSSEPLPPDKRSADDLYMLYTGGTTGLPKGVMYRIGDVARSFLAATPPLIGLAPVLAADDVGPTVEQLASDDGLLTAVAGPPLMHGAGVWIGAMAPHCLGSAVALLESRSFDADELIDVIEREHADLVVIVGDAFARPLLAAIRERAHADLSSLRIVASSGAMLSADSKQRLLDQLPGITILDLLGSSEGSMGAAVSNAAAPATTARFRLNPGVRVVRDDGTDVVPGSGEVGAVALTGLMVPIGYHKDPEKSARTFRQLDGVRYSFPGDMATVEEDGTIHLLGRGSSCINTGGEKVYPEEVEEAVKTHPAVADCLVVGVDDDRFGQAVAAVVAVDTAVTADELIAHAKTKLAGYKAPRVVTFVDRVPRAPNGKADYPTARALVGS